MNYLGAIINDQPVWDAIITYASARARRGTGDFSLKINCPMCTSRGQSADKRYRCGIIHASDHIGANCFNCGFTSKFVVGSPLSRNMMAFLANLGVPEREIKTIQHRMLEVARFSETAEKIQPAFHAPCFQPSELPPGSRSLEHWADDGCDDANYLAVVTYLLNRGEVAALACPYYWTPDPAKMLNRRLIIPCLHDKHLVGWIGRSIDPIKQKYYKQVPKDFLFNSRFITEHDRKYVFIVEGTFDALVIDGVAAMGATLNAQQIHWISQSGKVAVVIPDRDIPGKRLAEIGVQQGWHVAIPNYGGHHWWHDDVKDVDEAVTRYGKLYTLQSIVSSMTNDPQAIRQRLNYTL